jgi:hypothetical protein
MKPAPFEYARPSDLGEACALLAAGDDARIIAGGQSLVPLMAMRLARAAPGEPGLAALIENLHPTVHHAWAQPSTPKIASHRLAGHR